MKINYNLWQFLNKRRKIQFLLLVILMLVGSLAEIISIGLTLPFLASISSPDLILEEARQVFDNTVVAKEGDKYHISI